MNFWTNIPNKINKLPSMMPIWYEITNIKIKDYNY